MGNALEPRIYVSSLADYNNGRLHGTWIDLDGKDEDDVYKEINLMLKGSKFPNVIRRDCTCEDCGTTFTQTANGTDQPAVCPDCEESASVTCSEPYGSAEEFAIHDFEGFGSYRLQEYSGIPEVVKLAAAITEHGENAEAFLAFLSDRGDLDDAINNFEEAFQGEYDSELDFTYSLVDDTGMLSSVPENLQYYFDYEKFSRDLFINDYSSERLENGNVAVFNRYV